MTTYLGFNIGDSMFSGTCLIRREELTQAEFCRILQLGVVSCLNRSHPATIRGLKVRLGVDVSVPPTPPESNFNLETRFCWSRYGGCRGIPKSTNIRTKKLLGQLSFFPVTPSSSRTYLWSPSKYIPGGFFILTFLMVSDRLLSTVTLRMSWM